ncbi:MAG TPA: nucleotidyltransferase domain-containing protein [Prolixibacteraceae bacterium]|nr:nucleotidyltransferase domain-containing protein [Prolixibacteraceae bacterium]
MAKAEVIELLKRYIFLLRAEGISVDKAYLYGSYLNNTATNESDIDLMIVTDNDTDDYLTGKIWNLTKKVNSRIEPYLVSGRRFYSKENSPLIDLVKRTGLEIA